MDKRVWLSPRALKLHAVILVVVPAFMALCVWQIYRAVDGNSLSWAYVFEWPLLGLFAVYMWWKLLHPGFTFRRAREKPSVAPEYEGMLKAWQGEVAKLEMNRRAEEAGKTPTTGEGVTRDE